MAKNLLSLLQLCIVQGLGPVYQDRRPPTELLLTQMFGGSEEMTSLNPIVDESSEGELRDHLLPTAVFFHSRVFPAVNDLAADLFHLLTGVSLEGERMPISLFSPESVLFDVFTYLGGNLSSTQRFASNNVSECADGLYFGVNSVCHIMFDHNSGHIGFQGGI